MSHLLIPRHGCNKSGMGKHMNNNDRSGNLQAGTFWLLLLHQGLLQFFMICMRCALSMIAFGQWLLLKKCFLNLIHQFTIYFLPENNMKWVFFIFKESLLTLSHLAISFRSSFIILAIHLGSLPLRNKLVSSAHNMGNADLQLDGKSFTYTRNNKGPKIDPCGTPHVRVWWSDTVSL